MKRGRFITFEGIDGAGKSTHLAWAQQFLRGQGYQARGYARTWRHALGEQLRDLLLGSDQPIHAETEALLMFASAGSIWKKSSSRPCSAATGYCAIASPMRVSPTRAVAAVCRKKNSKRWRPGSHPDLQPDLTLFFDVSAEVGPSRVARIKSPDRFRARKCGFLFPGARCLPRPHACRAPAHCTDRQRQEPFPKSRKKSRSNCCSYGRNRPAVDRGVAGKVAGPHCATCLVRYCSAARPALGKRITALFLARGNPLRRATRDVLGACGNCASCHLIAAGNHPDLRMVEVGDGRRAGTSDRARKRLLRRKNQASRFPWTGSVRLVSSLPLRPIAAVARSS